jgi:YHS domain-containing protein
MWIEWLRRNQREMVRFAALAAVILVAGAAAAAGEAARDGDAVKVGEPMEAGEAMEAEEVAAVDTYPLETCIVSGAKLGSMGEAVIYEYEGREIRFCCAGCIKAFEKEPDKYIAKIDEARKAQAAANAPKPYPLDTCIVSGVKLGSMGDPIGLVYEGQEVKFCCAGCIPQFKSDPEKYMEKLHTVGSDPADETSEP